MAVFSVHLPGDGAANAADAAFMREGFSFTAFFFGPFWLAYRRLWLWLALWLAAGASLIALTSAGAIGGGAALTLHFFMHLLLGLEASRLVERQLWRQGYDFAEIIAAPALDQAETEFYRQIGPALEPSASPRALPLPPQAPQVLGSLPESGAGPGARH